MKLVSLLLACLPVRILIAENDEPTMENLVSLANAIDSGESVFEVKQQESLFIPFGEYPHPKGLQKFDAEAGQFLAQTFNSLPAKVSRLFTPGVPIYKGHPDVPGRPDSNPSAPAVGWVQSVQVANDGVTLGVKWNADGQTAISDAQYRFYSPNWLLRPVKGGIQPVKLLSVGLTNNPRIPVPAIANDDEEEKSQASDPMKLSAALLKLLGFAENDEPTTEQIEAAVEKGIGLIASANDTATQLATAQARVTELEGQLTAANDATIAARGVRIDAALAGLIDSTRLEPARRDAVRAELLALANDGEISTKLEELGKAEPKLKTAAKTNGLGAAKSKLVEATNDAAERQGQIREAIATELVAIANDTTKSGLSENARYDLAFNRAAAKHPALFSPKAAQA